MSIDDKVLSRIAGALSLAENAGTEAEAELAMATAQRIASTYSIDMAKARSHATAARRRASPTHRTITLGEQGKRGLRTYVSLFLAIARANDITCNIAHNSTYVIAFGFDEDITLVEALYASLVVQMVRGSDAYLRSGTYKDELVYRQVTRTDDGWRYTGWAEAPVSAATARINFQQAFAARIADRLADARDRAQADAIDEDEARMGGTSMARDGAARQPAQSGTELAIIEKAVEIRDYHAQHSRASGYWKGSRAATATSRDAQRAGDHAGRSARLGTEKELGGSRRSLAS